MAWSPGRSVSILGLAISLFLTAYGASASGQDVTSPPAEALLDSTASTTPIAPDYDPDQETPKPPVTPAQGADPYPNGPKSSKFLLGDWFGRPLDS